MQTFRSSSSPHSQVLTLRSDLTIDDPQGRLLRFSQEEYPYYDGIVDAAPDRIEPIDVLVTWSVNSNIYRVDDREAFVDPATKLRKVHRGLAERCNPLLSEIPENADLLSFDPESRIIGKLLREAVSVRWVGTAVATKVLHRKRRNLIPMLDSVVREHYLSKPEIASLKDRTNWSNKKLDVSLALKALTGFREDLRDSLGEIAGYRQALSAASYNLSAVRVLEILIWTKLRKSYEPRSAAARAFDSRQRSTDNPRG